MNNTTCYMCYIIYNYRKLNSIGNLNMDYRPNLFLMNYSNADRNSIKNNSSNGINNNDNNNTIRNLKKYDNDANNNQKENCNEINKI